MQKHWNNYKAKFLQTTFREQMLISFTGLAVVVFLIFNFLIEPRLTTVKKHQNSIQTLASSQREMTQSINDFSRLLGNDPNEAIQKEIASYEKALEKVDGKLLALTSDLISPVQMRNALLELLKVQKGVSLLSFELLGAKEVVSAGKENTTKAQGSDVAKNDIGTLSLYQHGIKIKLKGSYFQLRDYLQQLEGLNWTFFWQRFDYNVSEFPNSELEIEVYSLSTKKEFIGV